MVVVGGVPGVMVCIKVTCDNVVIVVEYLFEKIGYIGVIYVGGGGSGGYITV